MFFVVHINEFVDEILKFDCASERYKVVVSFDIGFYFFLHFCYILEVHFILSNFFKTHANRCILIMTTMQFQPSEYYTY